MTTHKLVPVEPTEEMLDRACVSVGMSDSRAKACYSAMLAAAPEVSAEPVGRIVGACLTEGDGKWVTEVELVRPLDEFTPVYAAFGHEKRSVEHDTAPQGEAETPRTEAMRCFAVVRGWPANTHPLSVIFDEMERLERELQAANEQIRSDSRLIEDVTAIVYRQRKEIDALRAQLAAQQEDAARLDWLERNLFERKWFGTLKVPSEYFVRGDFRHTTQRMRGETLREAIDAAMQEGSHD